MKDNILNMSLEEIKKGYSYDKQKDKYICNICGKEFANGEIFEFNRRYFNALKSIKIHVKTKHPDIIDTLISKDKKYTGITQKQKQLLKMIYSGMSNKQIAEKTGVKPSTVRHQRFVFREKAKQAKLFLSVYELAFLQNKGTGKNDEDEIMDIHQGAKMVDDRYATTKAEEEKIISNMFSCLAPLKLKTFHTKEKKKIVILKKIAGQFKKEKKYTEKEVNGIIKEIYDDFATIRRYLIEYGFMKRTKDCSEYRLI